MSEITKALRALSRAMAAQAMAKCHAGEECIAKDGDAAELVASGLYTAQETLDGIATACREAADDLDAQWAEANDLTPPEFKFDRKGQRP